jgi:hypothetical protein
MTPFGDTGRRRLVLIGLLAAPLALAGWVGAGIAQGAGVPAPSMQVLPKMDLKYGQTVQINGHHLPKGSGSVVATICGLQDSAGTTIAVPSAGDCASAPVGGQLAVVKAWQPTGEFDAEYVLPASSESFGTNHRVCDHAHRCELIVGDANPSSPVYRLQTAIFFADQAFVPPPAPTTAGNASAVRAPGSAQAPSASSPAASAAPSSSTVNTSAMTDTATTTTSIGTPGTTTTASTTSKPTTSSGHKRRRGESAVAAAGGPGTSHDQTGAGPAGGTTSGTGSGSGSGGAPAPTSPPTTAPPRVTVPPTTVPATTVPTTTVPTTAVPSDQVCADLSGIVQLVGGDCNVTAPTAPVTGIFGPLLGRY